MVTRHVPKDVRRQLRTESNFGCAYCGCPLIQYHHIVPFSEEEHHDPNRMVALCPTCHAEADAETIKTEKLYEMKDSPAIDDKLDHAFYFESEIPEIKYGGLWHQITNSEQEEASVLKIRGDDIIKMYFENDLLQFDVHFYNSNDELIAEIDKGEWWADAGKLWDLEYKKKTLTLKSQPERLALGIRYKPKEDQIVIRGQFYHKNRFVELLDKQIRINRNRSLTNFSTSGKGGLNVT